MKIRKPDKNIYSILGWLEAHLRKTECGKDFSELVELGLVSHKPQRRFPLHGHLKCKMLIKIALNIDGLILEHFIYLMQFSF